MNNQQELFKGEKIEEVLKTYFFSLGFYAARGAKFQYRENVITDIDLFLYAKLGPLARQRTNVDIKNKVKPQAFERILWANGLMKLLRFDSCLVATTDKRSVVNDFGKLHNTVIIDGNFLTKIQSSSVVENEIKDRVFEEELLSQLGKFRSFKTFPNRDWRFIYEQSKARLLTEMDFSGLNNALFDLSYFIEKAVSDEQKKIVATRMIYIVASHMLIIADFILKDLAFLGQSEREKIILDGINFGNLGQSGVEKILDIARQISGNTPQSIVRSKLAYPNADILKDFFSKSDTGNNAFTWAREFERLGFNRNIVMPETINSPLKAVLGILLDHFSIERKKLI